MNKKIISIVCLLLIMCMSFTLVACNNDKTPDTNDDGTTPGTECTVHVDADADGKCDTCGATVETETPNDPETPDVPQIDYTTDVSNAVSLINKMLKGEVTMPESTALKVLMAFSNVEMSGNLIDDEGATFPIKSIAMDGDLIKVTIEEDGKLVDTYAVLTEKGVYCVITDGETYDYDFETMDAYTVDMGGEVELPEVTEDDIVYDAVGGYFVIKESYIQKAMAVMNPETDEEVSEDEYEVSIDDMIGLPGLQDTLDAMTYEIKFKVSSENTISEFNVKGVVIQDEIKTEHLAVVYKNDSTGYGITATINYYVTISMKVRYDVVTDTTGKFTVTVAMNPPAGMGMEAQDFNFSVDVSMTENEIVVSDELKAHLDKAANIFENFDTIAAKYPNSYACDEFCSSIAVYDEEYGVYVVLVYDWEGFVFDHISYVVDEEYECVGTLTGDVLTVTEHCTYEKNEAAAAEKYEGVFTCENGCDTIVVWDEDLGQYAIFEQDFFNDGEYEFCYMLDEPWGIYCVGTLDATTKVLTVTEHNSFEVFEASIKGVEFTVENDTTCEDIYVEHEESGYYVFFYKTSNGKWISCGHSNWAPSGCQATIDLENHTMTIVSHSHGLSIIDPN